MLGWFQALMPREERFYPLFIQHSELIVACAEALDRLLKNGGEAARYCQEIRQREQEADEITREVHLAVRRTFITPFDRGDIKDLTTSMDNAIDMMQKTAKAVVLFDIRTFTPEMKAMGDLIVECAELVQEAVPLLAAISTHAARISAIAASC